MVRSSQRRCSLRKYVIRNFAKFIRKHLCQSLFLNKVADLSLQLYLKRDSDTGVFLRILQNFFTTLRAIDGFFKNKYLARLMTLLMFIFQVLIYEKTYEDISN